MAIQKPIKYSEKIGNTDKRRVVEYKHKIVPIKQKNGSFEPNFAEEYKVLSSMATINFEKYQRAGTTILVNFSGGWCTLTKDMIEL